MSKTPAAFLSLFPISTENLPGGGLATAGFSLRELAARYGTPLYGYDGATLKAQLSRLRGRLDQNYPGEAAVAYAAKVYFSTRFARRLAGLGLDLDVVSLGEMDAARQAGFKPASIHLHGNNKIAAEINAALEWGLPAIVADSLDELGLLCESRDFLVREARLPEPRRGDQLAVPVSGAYQLSMASNYNLAPRPAVPWLEDGQVGGLQGRERLDSWWGG